MTSTVTSVIVCRDACVRLLRWWSRQRRKRKSCGGLCRRTGRTNRSCCAGSGEYPIDDCRSRTRPATSGLWRSLAALSCRRCWHRRKKRKWPWDWADRELKRHRSSDHMNKWHVVDHLYSASSSGTAQKRTQFQRGRIMLFKLLKEFLGEHSGTRRSDRRANGKPVFLKLCTVECVHYVGVLGEVFAASNPP